MRTGSQKAEYFAMRDDVLKRFNGKCASCGNDDELEIHHIVPLCLGGTNNLTNLVPLCHRCHKAAHCGQHLSHYSPKKPSGRKSNLNEAEAESVLGKFFCGKIGTAEVKRLFGWSDKNRITDAPQFKKYVKIHGIASYRNNVDIVEKRSNLYPGRIVGYVVYTDGRRTDMIYQ